MKFLIAIDSDGTIRHSDGQITVRTKKIIKKIKNKGSVVVICTARPRYHTLKLSKEVELDDYLISSNGTEVYDNNKNENIFVSYLSKSVCKKIFSDIQAKKIRGIFVTDNIEYATQFIRNDSQILINEQNEKDLFQKNIKQIMIIGKEKEQIKKYRKIVEDVYNQNIIDSSDDTKEEIYFSVISNNASKGIALKKLANYLNIPLKNTIAIGNDKNDVPMFDVAGLSVAVSNAPEYIKNDVDIVTLSNDQDGVAVFLETYFK